MVGEMLRVPAQSLLPRSPLIPPPCTAQNAAGNKTDSAARLCGHLCRELRLLLGGHPARILVLGAWEMDLFAFSPPVPLGSSVTVSSTLIILSGWSTCRAGAGSELS
jgi:hypothetical protein